eukprot:Tamp_29078.p1 GENE.Tamp_29078~~Tamp_29078.p1  ORF type:complete len:105 (+),score=18.06 Tamp_29078:219-533(+)
MTALSCSSIPPFFFYFFSIFFFSQAAAEDDIAAGNDGSAAPFGAYMANALDQIALIHAAAHLAPFLILEDDLFVAIDSPYVQTKTNAAMDQLPASADMLYLGWY